MSEVFANSGFMRFSLGVFTKREQTVAFIQKVVGWDRAGIPSQFAVIVRGSEPKTGCNGTLLGYRGFFHHPEAARALRDHGFRELELSRVISLIHPENVPSRRVAEKKRDDGGEGNYFSRLSDAGVLSNSRAVGKRGWRLMNSRARAR
jgi:Acetyltransferase (GNAT) domain